VAVVKALIVNVQAPVPMHGPSQPVNWLPPAGVAASVMDVPVAYLSLQVAPRLIAPTLPVTVPAPLPDLLTVTVSATGSHL
jgi:hypothetical protein